MVNFLIFFEKEQICQIKLRPAETITLNWKGTVPLKPLLELKEQLLSEVVAGNQSEGALKRPGGPLTVEQLHGA